MLPKGIHLTLLMGPIVPVPAPRVAMDALDTVTVTTSASAPSGFQLSFQFSSRSELNTLFLLAAAQGTTVATPPLRVILAVTLDGSPQPLFDGVMTDVQVNPGSGGAPGTI